MDDQQMTHAAPPPLPPVVTRRFTELDALPDLYRELDIEYIPLRNPERGHVRLTRIDLGEGGTLVVSDMESPHLTHARVHPGFYHLGIVLDLPDPMTWNGMAGELHTGLLLRPGAELQVAAPGRNVFAALELPAARLEAAVRAVAGAEISFPETGRALRFDARTQQSLAELLLHASATATAAPETFAAPEARRSLCEAILSLVARAVDGLPRRAPERERTLMSHGRIVALAEAHMRERLGAPVYVSDLCTATGASERTLRSAFRNVFGMGPNRHLKLRRLNEVRRALRQGPPGTLVSEVAQRHGFWDLGRFAGDYRAVFGESPSQTLRHAGTVSAA